VKGWRARAAAVAVALGLAGCGGGGSQPAQRPATPAPVPASGAMAITSGAVRPGAALPARYTCDGPDVSPPMAFTGVPRHAAQLALVLIDSDARAGAGPFLHWVVFGIPRDVVVEPENELAPGALQAATSFGRARYLGPCPPPGRGRHYRLELYAERTRLLMLTAGEPGDQALQAIRAGATTSAVLPFTYARRG